MKVKISKENILKALERTDCDFDLKVMELLLDKMPTAYHKAVIQEEFYDNYNQKVSWKVTNIKTKKSIYFKSKYALYNYFELHNICKRDNVYQAVLNNRLCVRTYLIERLPVNYDVSSEIV